MPLLPLTWIFWMASVDTRSSKPVVEKCRFPDFTTLMTSATRIYYIHIRSELTQKILCSQMALPAHPPATVCWSVRLAFSTFPFTSGKTEVEICMPVFLPTLTFQSTLIRFRTESSAKNIFVNVTSDALSWSPMRVDILDRGPIGHSLWLSCSTLTLSCGNSHRHASDGHG